MNVVRAVSSEGFGRIRYYRDVRRRLEETAGSARTSRDGTSCRSSTSTARKDLGTLWDWLPAGALYHDPNAYRKASTAGGANGVAAAALAASVTTEALPAAV